MARTRNASRRKKNPKRQSSNPIVILEIGGIVFLVLIVILVLSSKGKSEKDTGKKKFNIDEVKKILPEDILKKEKNKNRSYSKRSGYNGSGYSVGAKPGKPPARPAPKVDITKGEENYEEAKRLWDKALLYREKGNTTKAKELLKKAANLLEEAVKSVDKLNMWIEDADWNDWAIDKDTMRLKRIVDRWLNLRSRIHKILPQVRR